MTDAQLDAFEALARAEKPQQWFSTTGGSVVSADGRIIPVFEHAQYIAAACPAAACEIIEELKKARKEMRYLAETLANYGKALGWPFGRDKIETWIEAAKEATCQKN